MFANEEERTKVKICGLTSLEDARFVSGALAHYLGFIFYEESPRYITHAEAGAIINWIEGPECVGVFVNQPLDDVNMIIRQTGIDLVQLHGNESPEYTAMVEKPVIKVIHVEPSTDAEELKAAVEPYLSHVEYLMFDTKLGDQWGGTGKTFDWSLVDEVSGGKPFFLSGGINEHNIRKACKEVQPYAVDLSSSLESEPGVKDFDKVETFMEEMREIWEEQEMGEL
ncbi:phosphoribosylanthranilate isomerase [Balneolaceae bacterium YR4-1]|uniref:N-(5'-phosphoribosyl)anthranilate isomerase n=1 Tax=Halalkalibaculum roseum TaxID=2709311 RepID=A0A6M1SVS8_9BACT|nr:phosphoribosylanthranilate isomerase [Halalkalibaculum roseum]NGP76236.1 phosphoribosylanthranilate isomerase [Halalkalibaculum roseum]